VTEQELVGSGKCFCCGDNTDLFKTKSGLRCENCCDAQSKDKTYFPSFRTSQSNANFGEEFRSFKNNLASIEFTVSLQDGTAFTIDELDAHAVLMVSGDEWEQYLKSFASSVAEHYEKETEPTRISEYAPWGSSEHEQSKDTYDSHEELAPVVLYQSVRPALFKIVLNGVSDSDISVIGINNKGSLTEYTSNGPISVTCNSGDD